MSRWPLRFRGWWYDGDQDDPGIKGPWETFTVQVFGEEAGDVRDLLPEDVPALMAALFDGPVYQYCPDCNGMGSVSAMDGQGRETEMECGHCRQGLVEVGEEQP